MRVHIVAAAALVLAATPLSAGALAGGALQTTEVVAPPSPDADALAAQMRLLAENPENIDALINAGVLATRVGDTAAASALFMRADRIAPRDPRLLAGKAALAVRMEHPGQALRLFDQAAAAGFALTAYLPDRGLAYDLTGDLPRAQRDYRDALKHEPNDEVTRRYALSLAMSGKRDQALELLDPLLRRSDRGAWRVRSFVLAMTGDLVGAEQIATSMLPPDMARGLHHFYAALPTLAPVDQAFAVHFGELRAPPERLADARLAPILTPLPAEPTPKPPVVAQVAAPRPVRGKHKRPIATPPPVPVPVKVATVVQPALPQPPREQIEPEPPVELARADPPPAPLPEPKKVERRKHEPKVPDALTSEIARGAPERVAETPVPAAPRVQPPAPKPTPPSADRPVRSEEAVLANIVAGLKDAPLTAKPRPEQSKPDEPKPVKSRPVAPDADVKLAKNTQLADADGDCLPAPAAKARRGAKTPVARRGRHAVTPSTPCLLDKNADKNADTDAKSAKGKALADTDCLPATSPKARKGEKPVAARRGAHRGKPSAKEATACPAETVADAKGKKGKAGKDDAATREPARIWVQVAGGANERDLAKAWAAVKTKAPAAFKGKAGWSTPLRATNRVLTGPFKTGSEAQAFVNMVAKSGISAFVFNSEAGQKIDKLGAQ